MANLFYEDVLAALQGARVRHVVVGGIALNLQGVPRFTSDLDVAVALEGSSLPDAARVLESLGLRSRLPIRAEDLGHPEVVRGWIEERNVIALTFTDPKQPLREVDLVLVSPVPFEEMEQTADHLRAGGLDLPVASIDVLIRMKSGTGRAQDASDVDALRRIQGVLRGR